MPQIGGAGRPHDVEGFGGVGDRAVPHGLVGVGQGAEPVLVVLNQGRVSGTAPGAEVGGVRGELAVVLDPVPRDVQRDPRGDAGELLHLGGVLELLERVAGHAGLAEDLEAGAGVAERPAGQLDGLGGEGGEGLFAAVGHWVSPIGVVDSPSAARSWASGSKMSSSGGALRSARPSASSKNGAMSACHAELIEVFSIAAWAA